MHRAPWPTRAELGDLTGDPAMLAPVAAALAGIRGAKSKAKVSMRTEVVAATVTGPASSLALAEIGAADLRAAGKITGTLVFTPTGDAEIAVRAELADASEPG